MKEREGSTICLHEGEREGAGFACMKEREGAGFACMKEREGAGFACMKEREGSRICLHEGEIGVQGLLA